MNDNQKSVLEYLESRLISSASDPLIAVSEVLSSNLFDTIEGDNLYDAYRNLTPNEEWQVLEEFCKRKNSKMETCYVVISWNNY